MVGCSMLLISPLVDSWWEPAEEQRWTRDWGHGRFKAVSLPTQCTRGLFTTYLFPDLLSDVIQFTGQCMYLQGRFKPLLVQEQVAMESLPPDHRIRVNLTARGGTRPLFQPHGPPQSETSLLLSWFCRWLMVSDSSGL